MDEEIGDELLAALAAALGVEEDGGGEADAEGGDGHSDQELRHVLDAARAARPRERCKQRGELLTAHMRKIKAAKRGAPAPISDHVLARIDRMNEEHAIRDEDHIDVAQR